MDAITLAAVRRELDEKLTGGRVQGVTQPHELALALEIYSQQTRYWLLLDASPQWPRIHLLTEKARRGVETDSPLLLLARKYLLGARLKSIHQPPWERILYLQFEHAEAGVSTLVGEIMGRWSNLLLLDAEGAILDSLRRSGPGQNQVRVILPGKTYRQPPPQAGKEPIDLITLAEVERMLRQTPAHELLWRVLLRQVGGISPLAARELAYRATGDLQADVAHPNTRPEALCDAIDWLRQLPVQGGWSPTIALDPNDDTPAAFAPYQLTHLGTLQLFQSISEAANVFYEAVVDADSYAGRRQAVQELLGEAHKKLEGRRLSLGEQSVSEEEVEELRAFGEWTLAYAWQVRPGDAIVAADTGEGVLHIPLDPALSAPENAQKYFERYHKAKRAAARVPDLLAETDRDLAYLDQLQSDLDLADNAPQIEELREALLGSGLVSEVKGRRRAPVVRSRPLRLVSSDGFEVIIGRNALQNETVTWKLAAPEDLWLHVQNRPGSHVVIKTSGQDVPSSTVAQAAAWAAYHSQVRSEAKAIVLVTQRRHLRKFKGARPGQVRVLQHRSITVVPQAPPAERPN